MNRHNSTFKQKTTYKGLKRSRFLPKKPTLGRGKPLRAKPDPKLKAWSRAVKKRDKHCQWPQCARLGPGVTIDAHHKAPRSQRPDLRYELTNGIVLCRQHHKHAHGEGKATAIALGILIEETYEAAQKEARKAA